MSRQLSPPSLFSEGRVSQLRKAFGISTHSVSVMTEVEDRAFKKGISSQESYYTTGDNFLVWKPVIRWRRLPL